MLMIVKRVAHALSLCWSVFRGGCLWHWSDEDGVSEQGGQEEVCFPGECVECGRYCSRLSASGSCEGCVMQAAIDVMASRGMWE